MRRYIRLLLVVVVISSISESVFSQTYSASVSVQSIHQLSIPLDGVIEAVKVKPGMVVKFGQELIRLDCRVYEQKYLQNSARVKAKALSEKNSQLNLDRTIDMYSQDLVSDLVMQAAEDEYSQASAEYKEVHAAQEIADLKRSYCSLKAGTSGSVLSVNTNVGDVVAGESNPKSLIDLLVPSAPVIVFTKKVDGAPLTVSQELQVTLNGKSALGHVSHIAYIGSYQHITVVVIDSAGLKSTDSVRVEY